MLFAPRAGIIGAGAAAPAYAPNAVLFDGTNDWLRKATALNGAVGSKLFTLAFSVRYTGTVDTDRHVLTVSSSGQSRLNTRLENDARFRIVGRNGAGTTILEMFSSISLTTDTWYNFLVSVDMANASSRFLFINDIDRLGTVVTYTDDTLDLVGNSATIGANDGGTNRHQGEIADLWFKSNLLTDFSVEANRRDFFSAAGCLVDKGSDGSVPGTTPDCYYGDDNDFDTWHLDNSGNGNDMTVNGALGDSANDPCGA